jgi:glutamate synthase domain-containing protein 2/nitrite reductase/ring-hydroxylating ferredoxin subunit
MENKMKRLDLLKVKSIDPGKPFYARASNIDLVLIRPTETEEVFVLYGRCQHRGALMSDGHVKGELLICCLHGSTYNYRTGKNIHYPGADLKKFNSWIEQGSVWVDLDEIETWEQNNPQKYDREAYQGLYADFKGTPDEPHVGIIGSLAAHGLETVGHHGPVSAMGVPRGQLPSWDDIQLVTAQLHSPPLLDEESVETGIVIGSKAKKPLHLDIPLFVSDMSFGALSVEAKTALSKGAELARTGICSGEGGMLDEEQSANNRYFYELASARFGYSMEKIKRCQAFHFKCGQAAKTGTGGHLPGHKVTKKIAEVRGLVEGEAAVSPARFPDWTDPSQYSDFAAEVREATGGIPIGVKLSAQHIEKDIDAALTIGVDYIILDGRGGGTGAAPLLFRDNISVPTIPALARARRHLDRSKVDGVTLIITGGLRIPADFIKALALGADAVALSNAAIQAIGCLGMRACHTNCCPVGIATQKPELRQRLPIDEAAQRLSRFLGASVELMQVMARACGHSHLQHFKNSDLSTWKESMARLAGVSFGGVGD